MQWSQTLPSNGFAHFLSKNKHAVSESNDVATLSKISSRIPSSSVTAASSLSFCKCKQNHFQGRGKLEKSVHVVDSWSTVQTVPILKLHLSIINTTRKQNTNPSSLHYSDFFTSCRSQSDNNIGEWLWRILPFYSSTFFFKVQYKLHMEITDKEHWIVSKW